MKHLGAAIWLFIVILVCLSACNGGETGPVDTTGSADTTPVTGPLDIVADGKANYVIVRPDKASKAVVDAAVYISTNIEKLTGVTPEITTDWVKNPGDYDSSKKEILVGLTEHSECREVYAGLGYGEYAIAAKGNKIVIGGWMDDATSWAAEEFVQKLRTSLDENKNLVLSRDLLKKDEYNAVINDLPPYEDGNASAIYDCGDSAVLAIFQSATAERYQKYIEKIIGSGYQTYTTNEAAGNQFTTLYNDDKIINVIFTPFNKQIRAIIEPASKTALPTLPADNVYTRAYDTTVTQVGLDFPGPGESADDYQSGMCYIIRLADGSFIIVDGGNYRVKDGKRIFDFLKDHAPDPQNIVIAAWIFTHGHGDHIGAFLQFSNSYASLVTIESFILNFPSDGQAAITNEAYRMPTCRQIMKNSYPGAKIIKAHPGQKFYLRNAVIEMLYTLELFAPNELSYFNTSSLIFTVELEGQKIMFLGDTSDDSNALTCKMYGTYLQSDFVQVAHHGSYGGSTQLYQLIDPTYAFWPTGESGFNKRKGAERSAYLFSSPKMKKIFLAANVIETLKFPYNG